MLQDVTVIEAGNRVSTMYCGRLLADAGAHVVRFEPRTDEEPEEPGHAAYLRHLREGKEVTKFAADELRDGTVARTVPELATGPAVVICDDDLPEFRALIDALRRENPRLVAVTVSDYGLDGPFAGSPATEFTLQAEAGITVLHPRGGRAPVATSVELGELTAGACAAVGAVTALLSGEAGQAPAIDVDVSRFEALLGLLQFPWLFSQLDPHADYPIPQNSVPGVERAKNGWVCVVAVTDAQWKAFKEMAGVPELDDPRYAMYSDRLRHGAEITPLVRRFTERHTVAELAELGVLHRVPVVPLTSPDKVADLPPYAERDTFVQHPEAGFLRPAPPFRITHACEGTIAAATSEAGPEQPLRGLRVVEFGTFQAGPLATVYLAGLGAEVIKVEAVNRPDNMRLTSNPMTVNRMWERSAGFLGPNTGKRDVTLDLSDPRGLDLAKRLVATADVVLENYTPRVLDSRGLDFEGLRGLNPDLVVLRMPAWGLTGSWRDRPGFAFTAEAAAGVTEMAGYADGEPVLTGFVTDPFAAHLASFVMLAAIRQRRVTGQAVCAELALGDVAAQLSARPVVEASATGERRTRTGNRSPHAAPQGMYPCTDDGWVAISVTTDEQWSALCGVLGISEWAADPELATLDGRREHQGRLDHGLAQACSQRSADKTVEDLRAAGVPAAVMAIGSDVVDHPQLLHRARVFSVHHPVAGTVRQLAPAMRFSPTPRPPAPRHAPLFGQDNQAVLTELGCTEAELKEFAEEGLIGESPYGIPFK
ncbi:CaiB/BaiF CoA-transferase family protein [Streptomyces soliscabiei]|uniref:CaiB/BaiF CoA-transferase family protein n=1 Tax=Streptomyces soliscabiei TaxID=588897 RepID=UPI0029B5CE92|nr:CoA transferase [Streptomyces sp. NY05-11A]MDX2675075.1 CoA transferase [Streptomyces sp. NY05-11A]